MSLPVAATPLPLLYLQLGDREKAPVHAAARAGHSLREVSGQGIKGSGGSPILVGHRDQCPSQAVRKPWGVPGVSWGR